MYKFLRSNVKELLMKNPVPELFPTSLVDAFSSTKNYPGGGHI